MAQSLELALMKKALSEQVFPMLRNAGLREATRIFAVLRLIKLICFLS